MELTLEMGTYLCVVAGLINVGGAAFWGSEGVAVASCGSIWKLSCSCVSCFGTSALGEKQNWTEHVKLFSLSMRSIGITIIIPYIIFWAGNHKAGISVLLLLDLSI